MLYYLFELLSLLFILNSHRRTSVNRPAVLTITIKVTRKRSGSDLLLLCDSTITWQRTVVFFVFLLHVILVLIADVCCVSWDLCAGSCLYSDTSFCAPILRYIYKSVPVHYLIIIILIIVIIIIIMNKFSIALFPVKNELNALNSKCKQMSKNGSYCPT